MLGTGPFPVLPGTPKGGALGSGGYGPDVSAADRFSGTPGDLSSGPVGGEACTKGVPGWVDEYAVLGRVRLVVGDLSPCGRQRDLRVFEVLHTQVQVQLLGNRVLRPTRRPVVGDAGGRQSSACQPQQREVRAQDTDLTPQDQLIEAHQPFGVSGVEAYLCESRDHSETLRPGPRTLTPAFGRSIAYRL